MNRNYRAGSIGEIKISLSPYLPILESTARFLYEQKLAPILVNIAQIINPPIEAEAARLLTDAEYDPAKIKITLLRTRLSRFFYT